MIGGECWSGSDEGIRRHDDRYRLGGGALISPPHRIRVRSRSISHHHRHHRQRRSPNHRCEIFKTVT
ncbi:hypothetical protein DY000_02059647 [Brassica cretica]|uniref:Uncharacterized protein n=1 Tax=Brassica cretica TaxID=69181 RepID=A0ABQ7B161_BRACR|nr:hypothetical protein DY000_02059647 [Brassica cretica]